MKIYRISGVMALLLLTTSSLFACGTIEMWHKRYFDATNATVRLNALKFIHCQPVVDGYKGTEDQNRLLAELLLTAMESTEGALDGSVNVPYTRDLVVKNLVRFQAWKVDNDQMNILFNVLARKKQMSVDQLKSKLESISAQSALRFDKGIGNAHQEYSKQVRTEIKAAEL